MRQWVRYLSPDPLPGDDEVWTEGTKEMLDDMHKRKTDMADGGVTECHSACDDSRFTSTKECRRLVINVGGYIGSSTRSEIEYALAHGKDVQYLVEI